MLSICVTPGRSCCSRLVPLSPSSILARFSSSVAVIRVKEPCWSSQPTPALPPSLDDSLPAHLPIRSRWKNIANVSFHFTLHWKQISNDETFYSRIDTCWLFFGLIFSDFISMPSDILRKNRVRILVILTFSFRLLSVNRVCWSLRIRPPIINPSPKPVTWISRSSLSATPIRRCASWISRSRAILRACIPLVWCGGCSLERCFGWEDLSRARPSGTWWSIFSSTEIPKRFVQSCRFFLLFFVHFLFIFQV